MKKLDLLRMDIFNYNPQTGEPETTSIANLLDELVKPEKIYAIVVINDLKYLAIRREYIISLMLSNKSPELFGVRIPPQYAGTEDLIVKEGRPRFQERETDWVFQSVNGTIDEIESYMQEWLKNNIPTTRINIYS